MRTLKRKLRRGHSPSKQLVIKTDRPWYWRVLVLAGILAAGYVLAFWQFNGVSLADMSSRALNITQQNHDLKQKVVLLESQYQVAKIAGEKLATDMAVMQEEVMRYKEDTEFYKSLLNENSNETGVKIRTFKILKTAQPRQYQYHLMLMQAGKVRNEVKARLSIKLDYELNNVKKRINIPIEDDTDEHHRIKFNTYRQLDGTFEVPENAQNAVLLLSFEDLSNGKVIEQQVKMPE